MTMTTCSWLFVFWWKCHQECWVCFYRLTGHKYITYIKSIQLQSGEKQSACFCVKVSEVRGKEEESWTPKGLRTESTFIKIQERQQQITNKQTISNKQAKNVKCKNKGRSAQSLFFCVCFRVILVHVQFKRKLIRCLDPWTWRQVILHATLFVCFLHIYIYKKSRTSV